jgi:hypothetical protein
VSDEAEAPSKNVAELAEALVELGLQTPAGKYLWAGFLLGAGLPKGEGGLTVKEAVYAPKPEAAPPASVPGPA